MSRPDQAKILIVDDSEDNRVLVDRILRRGGYETEQAADGLEAITIAASRGETFDLILLDWMMPELSGVDVLRAVRERFDSETLPIIMCTARDDGDCVSAALAEGANDYIAKPVDKDVLLARVAAQITRRRLAEDNRDARQRLEETLANRTLALAELKRGENDAAASDAHDDLMRRALQKILDVKTDADLRDAQELAQEALAQIGPAAQAKAVA